MRPCADPEFEAIIAEDNQVFNIGNATLTVIHTPGHTLESTSFLLKDESGKEHSIFTGDTLFLGDVGIPDVAQRYKGISKEELAGTIYDSVNNRIKPLPLIAFNSPHPLMNNLWRRTLRITGR